MYTRPLHQRGGCADAGGKTLGDCLGKGAFGSVYRALNWGNGETVAIKQVRLADLPKSELRVIMVGVHELRGCAEGGGFTDLCGGCSWRLIC